MSFDMTKFKVGDVVRVVRKTNSYSKGWENTWASEMDGLVLDEKKYTIKSVGVYGYHFVETDYFGWHWDSLELAPAGRFKLGDIVELTKPQVVGNRNSYSEVGSKFTITDIGANERYCFDDEDMCYYSPEALKLIGTSSNDYVATEKYIPKVGDKVSYEGRIGYACEEASRDVLVDFGKDVFYVSKSRLVLVELGTPLSELEILKEDMLLEVLVDSDSRLFCKGARFKVRYGYGAGYGVRAYTIPSERIDSSIWNESINLYRHQFKKIQELPA